MDASLDALNPVRVGSDVLRLEMLRRPLEFVHAALCNVELAAEQQEILGLQRSTLTTIAAGPLHARSRGVGFR